MTECLVLVRVRQPRVQVKDDWDGFGQRMTATGTLKMRDAGVETLLDIDGRYVEVPIFHEASLVALLAGIGRAALRDGVAQMRERTRIFNTSTGNIPRSEERRVGKEGRSRWEWKEEIRKHKLR